MKKPFFDTMARATMLAAAYHQDLSSPSQMQGEDRYVDVHRRTSYEATLKKVEGSAQEEEELHSAALASFARRNHDLGEYNVVLAHARLDDTTVSGWLLRRAAQVIEWTLRDIGLPELFDACRHSSGVTQGVPFMDTSLKRKSVFPWTTTLRASRLLELYDVYDSVYYDACLQESGSIQPVSRFEIVDGSRATTVPKQMDKRRMIAIEPTGNMFLQQGLMRIMYDRLASVGLDVTTLPLEHQRLAYWNSVSGHSATIDFSNASDSVTTQLVCKLFPARWLKLLLMTRSPFILNNGRWTRLHAYATMGNATTFPVETLVFWALGVACVDFQKKKDRYRYTPRYATSLLVEPTSREAVSVFGDDVVIPVSAVPDFTYVTRVLGFLINTEKSFSDPGPTFRESCGGDYYHGRDVRPFYIRGPATTSRIGFEAWLYVLTNTLLEKLTVSFGGVGYMYEKSCLELLARWLLEATPLVKVVPSNFPIDSGLQGLEGLRFARNYLPSRRIAPIGKSEQGWYTFKFLRYRYKRYSAISEALTYAVSLKENRNGGPPSRWYSYLPREDEFLLKGTPIRKKGEYIVARSTSRSF